MPKIEDVEGGVRVTFKRNNVVNTATENATENATGIATGIATMKLNKTQQGVLSIIYRNKFATYDEIASQLIIDRTTVWRNIKKLQEVGRIRRIGGDKGGHWEIIEDTKP